MKLLYLFVYFYICRQYIFIFESFWDCGENTGGKNLAKMWLKKLLYGAKYLGNIYWTSL